MDLTTAMINQAMVRMGRQTVLPRLSEMAGHTHTQKKKPQPETLAKLSVGKI